MIKQKLFLKIQYIKNIYIMLILEIILTIIAWGKGWRWFSLIPVGVALSIGFMLGINEVNMDALGSTTLFIEILVTIALILMIIYPKKKKEYGSTN